jgi:hypothetical protein
MPRRPPPPFLEIAVGLCMRSVDRQAVLQLPRNRAQEHLLTVALTMLHPYFIRDSILIQLRVQVPTAIGQREARDAHFTTICMPPTHHAHKHPMSLTLLLPFTEHTLQHDHIAPRWSSLSRRRST